MRTNQLVRNLTAVVGSPNLTTDPPKSLKATVVTTQDGQINKELHELRWHSKQIDDCDEA